MTHYPESPCPCHAPAEKRTRVLADMTEVKPLSGYRGTAWKRALAVNTANRIETETRKESDEFEALYGKGA